MSMNRALVSKDPLKAGPWNGPFYLLESRPGSGKGQRNVFFVLFCAFLVVFCCNLLLAHCLDFFFFYLILFFTFKGI